MKHPTIQAERADLLTQLYAARSTFGALFVTANTHHELQVATQCASARDALNTAITHLEQKISDERKSESV